MMKFKRIRRNRKIRKQKQAKARLTHIELAKSIFGEIGGNFWEKYYSFQNQTYGETKKSCTCQGCVIFDAMYLFALDKRTNGVPDIPKTKTMVFKIPVFLLTELNLDEWFPHARLSQDSAMLLFFIKKAIGKEIEK